MRTASRNLSATLSRRPTEVRRWRAATSDNGPLRPPQLGCLRHAPEALQRKDRIRQLIGAAVQHRAGQRQEFLLHGLRIRERARLSGWVDMQPLMHAVIARDRNPRAE